MSTEPTLDSVIEHRSLYGIQQGTPQSSSFKLVRTKMWDFINCGRDLTEFIGPIWRYWKDAYP